MTDPMFLIWCRTCTPEPDETNPTSIFGSARERGQWAAEHAKAHAEDPQWLVVDLPLGARHG